MTRAGSSADAPRNAIQLQNARDVAINYIHPHILFVELEENFLHVLVI